MLNQRTFKWQKLDEYCALSFKTRGLCDLQRIQGHRKYKSWVNQMPHAGYHLLSFFIQTWIFKKMTLFQLLVHTALWSQNSVNVTQIWNNCDMSFGSMTKHSTYTTLLTWREQFPRICQKSAHCIMYWLMWSAVLTHMGLPCLQTSSHELTRCQ